MSTAVKVWIIVASALILFGALIFVVVMTANNWDFRKLSTVKYETNTYEFDEEIRNISVDAKTTDIDVLPSTDGKTKLVCYEEQKIRHSVELKDAILTVQSTDERKWYELIGINFGTPKMTLYLPEREYGSLVITNSTGEVEIAKELKFDSIDVSLSTGHVDCYASAEGAIKISASTGHISLAGVSAEAVELSVSTGDIEADNIACSGEFKITVTTGDTELENVRCKSFSSTGDTGDISFENVTVEEKFSVERSTGDVRFEDCDAGEMFIKTSTGDVKGELLTAKTFITSTNTGKIRVPRSTEGGYCEVRTSTGDIIIEIDD